MKLKDLKKGDRFTATITGTIVTLDSHSTVVRLDGDESQIPLACNHINNLADLTNVKKLDPPAAIGDKLFTGNRHYYTIVAFIEKYWIVKSAEGGKPEVYTPETFKDYTRTPADDQ